MTTTELEQAKKLYKSIKAQHYGTVRYKSAKTRYDKYIEQLAHKYNCSTGEIHATTLEERKNV